MSKPTLPGMPEAAMYCFNSGVLYAIASSACTRSKHAEPESAAGMQDSLVAIAFAAMTLESFIMEFAVMAAHDAKIYGHKEMLLVHSLLEAIETARGNVQSKFNLAKLALSGSEFVKGALPFQDFDLLIGLRNAIVHLKPEKLSDAAHKLVEKLAARKLIAEHVVGTSWISQIALPSVAKWACDVVVDMVESVHKSVPHTTTITTLRQDKFARVK